MARYRTVESAIWDDPDLRRLGMVARLVFHYLVERGVDDEGRFRADCFGILEAAFSRNDVVTEADVSGALESLVDCGKVVLYGEHQEFGFLTGWFEHQAFAPRYRTASTLPAPPVPVASWEDADRIRDAYAAEVGRSPNVVSRREALRRHVGQTTAHRERTVGAAQADSKQSAGRASAERMRAAGEAPTKRRLEGEVGRGSRSRKGENDNLPLESRTSPEDAPADADAGPGLHLLGDEPPEDHHTPLADDAPDLRSETPDQITIRETWELVTGEPLPGKLPGYSGIVKLLLEHGRPKFLAWAQHMREHDVDPPEGADPWRWFQTELRRGMARDFEWMLDSRRRQGGGQQQYTAEEIAAAERSAELIRRNTAQLGDPA